MATAGDVSTGSIARGLALVQAFRAKDRSVTAAELARRTHLPRSTAYRLAAELAGLGILEQADDGQFRLGMNLFELGQLALYQRGLREAASTFLADLSYATHQIAHLAVLDGWEVMYIDIIRPSPSPRIPSRPGGRMPCTVTGVGKAILAFSPPDVIDEVISHGLPRLTTNSITDESRLRMELAKIRRTGIAFDHQEQTVGISCCAAPIFTFNRKVVGSISVTGNTSTIRLDLMAAAVQSTAAGISRTQGG